MTSVDAIINRVINGMGHVEDCDVVRVCIEHNTTTHIDSEVLGRFIVALPDRQYQIAQTMTEAYACPQCGNSYCSATGVLASGAPTRRCPYCGQEW